MPFEISTNILPDGRIELEVVAAVSTPMGQPEKRKRIITQEELIKCLKIATEHSLSYGQTEHPGKPHTNECLWKEFGFES